MKVSQGGLETLGYDEVFGVPASMFVICLT